MLQDRSPIKLKNADVNKQTSTSSCSDKKLAKRTVLEQSTRGASKLDHSEIPAKRGLVKPDKQGHNVSNMLAHTNSSTHAISSHKRTEVELVSERVAKTKNEIEQLKAQLQKLINDGITKTDYAETKQNVAALSTEFKTGSDVAVSTIGNNASSDVIKAKSFISGVSSEDQQPAAINSRISVRQKHRSPPKQPIEEVIKKVRHYDQNEAREYIKKQKEKRKELMKGKKKEAIDTTDMKKQRLQELRKKSLELVSKNVQHKRERSRSREAPNQPDEIAKFNAHSSLNLGQIDKSNVVPTIVINEMKPDNNSSRKRAHPQLQNITIRSRDSNRSAIPTFDIPPLKLGNLDKRQAAAVKIQAAFRGYRQRKLFQQAQKQKRVHTLHETSILKKDIPAWLQTPTALPYPYNFINAVKRKLNLAVQQTTNTTTDAAVQSSLIEPHESKVQKSESACNELRDKSSLSRKNTDLKSFLSHKCLELDVRSVEPLVLTRKSEKDSKSKADTRNASDSDTSKNIPDISSESSIPITNNVHSSKRPHSSDTDHHDEPQLRINTDRVKKLKLRPNSHNSRSREISERLVNSDNQIIVKTNSEILTERSRLENNSMERHLSGRDSIIASNQCNYVSSISIPTNISAENLIQSKLKKLKAQNSESAATVTKTASTGSSQDTLHSFRTYMNDLHKEGSEEMKTKTESKSLKSSKTWDQAENKENVEKSQTTESPPTEKLKDVSVKDNLSSSERAQSSIKTDSSVGRNRSKEKPIDYSSNFTSIVSSPPSLKRPSVSLKSSLRVSSSEDTDVVDDRRNITNITLRPDKKSTIEGKVKSNEIHLKFEAELHLLNEFNDSLRQVMAVEKSLLELHNNKNVKNNKATTTYHTRDTQTSVVTKTSTDTKITTESQGAPEIRSDSKIQTENPAINYSRGSDVMEQMDALSLSSSKETNDASLITTGLELSQLKEDSLTSSIEESNVDVSVSVVKENRNGNIYAGLSLDMFEQLIKDEDARIENLKTILKIREKALVDRTKGELAWLEIQKKHLRDSGQLQEISAIKKKQRGLLIKLEHERHEMQRLKQMQKAASKERKSVLREQRNMIKAQLSTSNMITKIKRSTREERRQSGPLKVYNIKSHSESIRSETSMSRRSSATEEVVSVVSHSQSIVSHVTEEILSGDKIDQRNSTVATIPSNTQIKTDTVKRSLLMREAALQKRRKAAEELLQWHQRLVEEEGKIAELELAASAIISQIPTGSMGSDEPAAEKHKFRGSQLNLLWRNMTGREEKKFNDQVTYSMSKITLERFCKDAKKHALGRSKSFSRKSAKHSDSANYISENVGRASRSSSDEKSGKLSRSSKSIPTEIAGNEGEETISKLITEAETNYVSDFESVPKDSPVVDSEKIVTNFSVSDKTQISEMSSQEQSILDESQHNGDTSLSENEDDINTITEASKTYKNTSVSSKPTEIINDTTVSNELSPTASKVTNINSTTEIIEEKSSSEELIKPHSVSAPIPENFNLQDSTNRNKIPHSNSNDESDLTNKISSFSTKHDSEINSKDSKDLDTHHTSPQTNEVETERTSLTEEHPEIIKSLIDVSTKTSSVCSEASRIKTNDDESEQLGTDSIHSEIVDELVKNDVNERSVASSNAINTEVQSKKSELHIIETADQLLSETNENQPSSPPNENELLSKTNEVQLSNRINETRLSNQNEAHNQTSEDQLINDEGSEMSLQDTTINEELSSDKSALISSANKIEENEEKQSMVGNDTSAIKTIENEDNTEALSHEESNLSDKNSSLENETRINENSPIIDESKIEMVAADTTPQENNSYDSEKIESPLELSYGFLEKKKPINDHQQSNDTSLENNEENLTDTSTSYNVEPQFAIKNQEIEDNSKHEIEDHQESKVEEEQSEKQDERTENAELISKDHQDHETKDEVYSNHENLEAEHSKKEILSSAGEENSVNDGNRTSEDLQEEEVDGFSSNRENLETEQSKKEFLSSPGEENSVNAGNRTSEDLQEEEVDGFSSNHENLEADHSKKEILSSAGEENSGNDSEQTSEDLQEGEVDEFSSNRENLETEQSKKEFLSSPGEENSVNDGNRTSEDLQEEVDGFSSSRGNRETEQSSPGEQHSGNDTEQTSEDLQEGFSSNHENLETEQSKKGIISPPADGTLEENFVDDAERISLQQQKEIKNEDPETEQSKQKQAIDGTLEENSGNDATKISEDLQEEDVQDGGSSSLKNVESEQSKAEKEIGISLGEDKSENESEHTSVDSPDEEIGDESLSTHKSIKEKENSNVSTHEASEDRSENDSEPLSEYQTSSSHKNLKEESEEQTEDHQAIQKDDENQENIDVVGKPVEIEHVDVKRRVLEILADANIPSPRGDKSPRLQDLYVTAYDIASSDNSPELASPSDDSDQNFTPPQLMYGSDEVEELLKKQLAIEQEIKEIQQQQQKEQLPYLYLREIPNKPPPPYTPPVSTQAPVSGSVLPNSEGQIGVITNAAADILHGAYLNNNLQNITLSAENKKMLHSKSNIDKSCFELVFDLCKEAAIEHYKQFDSETGPSWMHLDKTSKLSIGKPLDRNGLEKLISERVRQFLGYETVKAAENIKRKWCGKKRDHVDELLVVECQAEETEWTNYDRDELIVKDELAKEIMNMLLSETAQVFSNILTKKTFLC